MELLPEEISIVGNWIYRDRKMFADDNCKRIHWLATGYLKTITTEDGNWTTIYQDPSDQRYWRLTYPKSELQGGGPPVLENIGSMIYFSNENTAELTIQNYTILETGNDGGHRYIEGKVLYKNKTRRITIFFESKLDETKLNANTTIKVEGELQDDGEAYGLIIRHAKFL